MPSKETKRVKDPEDFTIFDDAPDEPKKAVTVDARAEASLIATVISRPELYDELENEIKAEDFAVRAHYIIWDAIGSCDSQGQAFDTITISRELEKRGELLRIGGIATIDTIANSPLAEDINTYVKIITEASLRRKLAQAGSKIVSVTQQPEHESEQLRDIAEVTISEALDTTDKSSWTPLASIISEVHAKMANSRDTRLLGHPTGFSKLDDITAGLQPGQLILIAGRPGTGKSVLALQLAAQVAKEADITVPFLSYEMSSDELGFRLLSSATGINMSKLQLGQIPDNMDYLVAQEAEKLSKIPLLIDDTPPRTISGVRSALRRLARRGNIGAVVVDYLQLMHGDVRKTDSRAEEISTISRELKLLAKELEVPIIACSQLNRSLEQRPNKRPQLSDLRESGALEQDSNVVMFLYRDAIYNSNANPEEAELIVAKNRNGAAGVTVPLKWEGHAVRFKPGSEVAPVVTTSRGGVDDWF